MCQKQHCDKQECDHPGAAFDFFKVTAENADDNVGNQSESNTIGDIIRKWHDGQGEESGNCGFQIVPVDILNGSHHQKAHINQSRSGSASGNELRNWA